MSGGGGAFLITPNNLIIQRAASCRQLAFPRPDLWSVQFRQLSSQGRIFGQYSLGNYHPKAESLVSTVQHRILPSRGRIFGQYSIDNYYPEAGSLVSTA